MNEDLKRCGKGDFVKKLSEFIFRKDTQKHRNQCRGGVRSINKEDPTMNKEEFKIGMKEYCENIKNKNLERIFDIDYRERNRKKFNFVRKIIFKIIKNNCIRKIKKRKDEDNNFRLACNLRKRLLKALYHRMFGRRIRLSIY